MLGNSLIASLVLAATVFGQSVPQPGAEDPLFECGETYSSHPSDGLVAEFDQPWRVELRPFNILFNQALDCGGVLVSDRFVLTTARCVAGPGWYLMEVRIGNHGLEGLRESYPYEDRRIRKKIVHEHFDTTEGSEHINDIALLELTSPVRFREHILPACLPQEIRYFAGEIATVAELGPFDLDECSRTFSRWKLNVDITYDDFWALFFRKRLQKWTIPETTLYGMFQSSHCAAGRTLAGTPLILEKNGRHQAIGITSWLEPCSVPGAPNMSDFLAIFTDVSAHIEWVHANMKPSPKAQGSHEEVLFLIFHIFAFIFLCSCLFWILSSCLPTQKKTRT